MVTMRSFSADLSLGAQTSYAELLDMTRSVEGTRFGTLRGSFHRRKIKGKTYLYFNFRDIDGSGRSVYVGPEGARVQRLIDEFEQGAVFQQSLTALSQRAQACIALGCDSISTKQFRAIQKLAGRGFFRVGGVLVGTQAFVMMGNMLGLHWNSSAKAMDLGFAHVDPIPTPSLPARRKLQAEALPHMEVQTDLQKVDPLGQRQASLLNCWPSRNDGCKLRVLNDSQPHRLETVLSLGAASELAAQENFCEQFLAASRSKVRV